jgi:hypothetical protein
MAEEAGALAWRRPCVIDADDGINAMKYLWFLEAHLQGKR